MVPGNLGFIKLVVDSRRGLLVGATSAGPSGGEVLSMLARPSGLEIDVHRLRGRPLRLALASFVASFAVAVGFGLAAGGYTRVSLLVAIVLCATSLGLVVPVLKDAGQIDGDTDQLIVAAASIADFGSVILLSLCFRVWIGNRIMSAL